jgi:hypothetical protein
MVGTVHDVFSDIPTTPPVRVRPFQVRAAGRELRAIGRALDDDLAAGAPALSGGGAGGPGWATAGAAGAAADGWHDLLAGLAARIDRLGQAMAAAADAYAAADARAGGRAGEVLRW